MAAKDYYVVLGVSRNSSEKEIKQAYRRLARRHHPDVSTSPDSTDRMQQLNEAYRRIMAQFENEA